jgi:hypothetical protein
VHLTVAGAAPLLTGLEPDRDEARRWLAEELAQAEYNRPEPIVTRVVNWVLERLAQLVELVPGGSGLSQLLLVVVVLLALAALAFALRGRLRQGSLRERGSGAVLEDPHLTARDYRARSERAWRAGDWDGALLDSYRAVAASADERTLLDDLPGRTAHEVAVALATPFAEHAPALRDAADRFDDVRYGEMHATREQAERVRMLEATLSRTRPRLPVAP